MSKYLFIGNRFFVLKKMLNLGCAVTSIYAVKDSYLEKELLNLEIGFHTIESKEWLIDKLKSDDFDVLVSNGCPYILPISDLQNGNRKFINVHPSLLPDLKGKHPINGALLFDRKHGVTCHYMTDKIDDGEICSQVEIPISDDIDIELLYKISFFVEGEVFEKAYLNGFKCAPTLYTNDSYIYYSRKESDRIISDEDPVEVVLRKAKAFSIEGQYSYVIDKNISRYIKTVKIIKSEIATEMYKQGVETIGDYMKCGNNKYLRLFNGELLEFEFVSDTES